MNVYQISFTRGNGSTGSDRITAPNEEKARRDFKRVYRPGDLEITGITLVESNVPATKQQERDALWEIRKIVEELGPSSYVGTAFQGCFEDAMDNIENDFLKKDRLQVTIHYDPIVTADASVGVLRARLKEHARQLDPRLSIHDLRIVPGDSHTNVLFDLVFPAGYTGDIDQMLAKMCQFVKEQDPKYCCVVKVEQSYASALPDKK